jgi:hypothetical protein
MLNIRRSQLKSAEARISKSLMAAAIEAARFAIRAPKQTQCRHEGCPSSAPIGRAGQGSTLTAGNPAMMKRPFAASIVILIGLALASCSSFSSFVSDHWPTWAGGMPKDIPPRPGAPGYDEFLVHQQGKDVAPPPGAAANANAQGAVPGAQAPNNASIVQGGLY